MNHKPFIAGVAVALVIVLVAEVALLAAPPRAAAQSSAINCAGGLAGVGLGLIFSALAIPAIDAGTNVGTGSTAGSTISDCINNVILKPLAQSMIRLLLQQVTSSIINWINNTPGTGRPSFVRNLSLHLQSVGDAVALPFINQVGAALNPSFGAAIASSLLNKYALGTSVGGFFAANRSTLNRASPNPSAFLAGDWSRGGGIPAWFELTTKSKNNPYLLYPAAENELQTLVEQAQTNRRQDLTQSNGFLSWCGPQSESSIAAYEAATEGQSGVPSDVGGVNPRTSCYDSQGRQVNAQTPGTVIRDYTQQVLGSDIAQLINPTNINEALVAVLQVAINQGIKGLTTSLFSASESSSYRPQSITSELYRSASSGLGGATSVNSIVDTKLAQMNSYLASWSVINGAANGALQSATSLKNNTSCASQVSAADTAIGEANSVLAQAQSAQDSVSGTRTLALQIQQEATGDPTKAATDAKSLQSMAPSVADVTAAAQDARTTGGAKADPSGSLSVSGGTLVDRMNLISQNASMLNANNCAAP